MTWEAAHTITVRDLDKRHIWRVWEDVDNWHLWDTDIEYARLEAPFAVGSRFELKPKGGPKVRIELADVRPEAGFTDVTRFPLARMYGIHAMRETSSGLEISHVVRVEGPLGFLWRKLVAEKVAAGLEEQATNMVQRARTIGNTG